MKYLKYSLLLLLIAIITDVTFAGALTDIAEHKNRVLKKNETDSYYSGAYVKDTWTIQAFELLEAKTSLTNPCSSCVVVASLKYGLEGTEGSGGVFAKAQDGLHDFLEPSSCSSPGTYRINAWRYDITLLNTTIHYKWYINAR